MHDTLSRVQYAYDNASPEESPQIDDRERARIIREAIGTHMTGTNVWAELCTSEPADPRSEAPAHTQWAELGVHALTLVAVDLGQGQYEVCRFEDDLLEGTNHLILAQTTGRFDVVHYRGTRRTLLGYGNSIYEALKWLVCHLVG